MKDANVPVLLKKKSGIRRIIHYYMVDNLYSVVANISNLYSVDSKRGSKIYGAIEIHWPSIPVLIPDFGGPRWQIM